MRALRRALLLRHLTIQFLWLPLTMLALLLGVGFHTLVGATNVPKWLDALLNALALGFFISLGLLPLAALALPICRFPIRRAAQRALAANVPALIPLRRGERLGRTKVARLTPTRLTLVSHIVPDVQRITGDIALVASAVSFPALITPQKNAPIISVVFALSFIYGLIALVLALVNTRRVIDVSVSEVRGQLAARFYLTISACHWPRLMESADKSLDGSCSHDLGFQICPELSRLNTERLEIALSHLQAAEPPPRLTRG